MVTRPRIYAFALFSTILLTLATASITAAYAQESKAQPNPPWVLTYQQQRPSLGLTAELQGWFYTGDLNWRIRIPASPVPPLSELIFPTAGTLPILRLNWARTPPWEFTLRFGTGGINRGTSTDSDWLTTSPTPSLQSQQPSSGNAQLWSLDANYTFRTPERTAYAVFVGWQSWTYNIRMVDPITYTICDPAFFICPPLGVPMTTGLNSTYDITYSGPRLGIRATSQVSDKVMLFGSASYGWITASGTGFWNLRNLTFRHSGNGTATVVEVAMAWTPSENWMVRLGYTYATISATGRETLFCIPGGFCGDPGLNWDAKTTNQGVTLAATYSW